MPAFSDSFIRRSCQTLTEANDMDTLPQWPSGIGRDRRPKCQGWPLSV